MDAKELIAFLRQHADWHEEGFGAQAPEIVAHVKKLREWADQLAAIPSDAAQAPMTTWQTGTPNVPKGKAREFIVAIRRAQSGGKVFVFSATYANEFSDDGALHDRDGEEFIATGWFYVGLDISGEFHETYSPLQLNKSDEIVGWQNLPKWNDAAPVAPAAAAPSDDLRKAVVSLELTATWLDGDCDPARASTEIRAALDRIRPLLAAAQQGDAQ